MTLDPGTRLGHYEVLGPIGAGGMGEVYKATDTRLDRTVAVKVLAPHFAESPERKQRFEREARTISKLNHPNICTLHDIGIQDGIDFLVMEYIEGDTLADRLKKRPLSREEALGYAVQIADALTKAHRAGIVHRDLKPGNIMLTKEGVKLLDFGLAKLVESDSSPDESNAPTVQKDLTHERAVVGTPRYMAPEQLEGGTVDARTDLYTYGLVLREMLKVADADIERVVSKCLERDPDERWQTAKDLGDELRWLTLGPKEAAPPPSRLPVVILASVLFVALAGHVVWWVSWGTRGSGLGENFPRLTRPVQVTSSTGVENHPSWSPEAGRIAYDSERRGTLDIWVSQVGGGAAINLTEDHDGLDYGPRWSPDGSQIAFKSARDGGGCFVMPALGGTPRRVAPSRFVPFPGEDPVWSPDGSMLGCPSVDSGSRPYMDLVTMASQSVERLALPGQYSATNLSWSPDGRFLAYAGAISETAETTVLWLVSLSGEAAALSDGKTEIWSPMWSPDGAALLYISNRGGSRDLWLQNLDGDAKPHGEPRAVTTGLGIQSASLIADGTKLAYSKGGRVANVFRIPIRSDRVATWADAEQLTFDQAFVEFVDLSPDGTRLVINSNRNGFQDLWVLPAEGGEMTNLTNDPAPDWMPAWSPDGSEIAFYTGRSGNRDIYVIPSVGGPARQLTTETGGDIMPAWSPDGKAIAYVSIRDGNFDIRTMSPDGTNQARLTDFSGQDNLPDWSPDGEWIAYSSRQNLWRVPAKGGEPEQLTQTFGRVPRWAPDGAKLYYSGPRESRTYWMLSLRDRAERAVADLSGKTGIPGGFALATDGDYLYFTWEETSGDIWVMDVLWDE